MDSRYISRLLSIAQGEVPPLGSPQLSKLGGRPMHEVRIGQRMLEDLTPDQAVDEMLDQLSSSEILIKARSGSFEEIKKELSPERMILDMLEKLTAKDSDELKKRRSPSEAFLKLLSEFKDKQSVDEVSAQFRNNLPTNISFDLLSKVIEGFSMCGLVSESQMGSYDLAWIVRYVLLALINAGVHPEEFENMRLGLETRYQAFLDKLHAEEQND